MCSSRTSHWNYFLLLPREIPYQLVLSRITANNKKQEIILSVSIAFSRTFTSFTMEAKPGYFIHFIKIMVTPKKKNIHKKKQFINLCFLAYVKYYNSCSLNECWGYGFIFSAKTYFTTHFQKKCNKKRLVLL